MIAPVKNPAGSRPRVSIGVPVYNGAEFLEAALDSLLAQTYDDFELIISDNGSTDETESICRRYAERDRRIRYHREQRNRGACWNFNRVFELARGEYFKYAAHDDLCSPSFLARCIEVLDNDPTLVCCHTRTAKIDPSGQVITGLPDPTDGEPELMRRRDGSNGFANIYDGSSDRAHHRFRDVLLNSGWSVRCYGLVRSDALRRTGLLRPVYGYEKVVMGELALLGRYHIVPQTLFFQRVHPQASSSLTSAARQHEMMAAQPSHGRWAVRLKLLGGHLRAAMQMPLSVPERFGCLLWIGVYLLQVRKWRRVLSSILRGTGTGAVNRNVLEQIRSESLRE